MNKCSDCHSHSMPLNGLDGFRCACVIRNIPNRVFKEK